jgi:hypothetical protein
MPSRASLLSWWPMRLQLATLSLGADRSGGYGPRPMFPSLRSLKSGPVFRMPDCAVWLTALNPLRYQALLYPSIEEECWSACTVNYGAGITRTWEAKGRHENEFYIGDQGPDVE